MAGEGSSQSQIVGNSRSMIDAEVQGASTQDASIASVAEDEDVQLGEETGRFFPLLLRNRVAKHTRAVGRHFNVLDRLFKRNRRQVIHLQQGASYDGVFSNLSAKPDINNDATTGSEDNPPTYDEAAVDMAPSYYGVDEDGSGMYYNEICIEGLPVGNLANLIWNMVVSSSFQFIGFLITYILHTSHAAKQGSRFGLGLTFMGYAYSMSPNDVLSKVGKDKQVDRVKLSDPTDHDDLHLYSSPTVQDDFEPKLAPGAHPQKQELPLLAVFTGLLGIFIMLKSLYDYVQIKKMERKFLSQEQSSP
ncbi:hypothetical protein HG536_0A04530 [Torulaspora globosa]|uniref:Metal homeostatis protein BSD2 n=1 Tax=Torulaspora globosa TaxID=48254 RepID=A0A7G3ZAV0_9SACH|nr:uncharacterized protein HG536_0A04530 [Torulaspora globosa]QLL30636.1 hypothetical protein HG536_0A04530 [Torulaspora globosa]